MTSPCCGAPLTPVLPAYPGLFVMYTACQRVYETRSLKGGARRNAYFDGGDHPNDKGRKGITRARQQA